MIDFYLTFQNLIKLKFDSLKVEYFGQGDDFINTQGMLFFY